MIERRAFIGTVAGGLVAAPFATEAQQAAKVPLGRPASPPVPRLEGPSVKDCATSVTSTAATS